MVSAVPALLAIASGLLLYLVVPIIANSLKIELRQRIGATYYALGTKSLKRIAVVQRSLGSLELMPFDMDDENKVGKVTLDSGLLGDDKVIEFEDPADRIHRLDDKPLTLLVEGVPSAIDAELAELGYWKKEHSLQNGIRARNDSGNVEAIDPHIPMGNYLRAANPADVTSLLSKAIQPQDIKTARELTKERMRKYGERVGMAETASVAISYAIGVGGVAVLQYVDSRLVGGGGGGGGGGSTTVPIPPQIIGPDVADVILQVVVIAV